MTIYRCGITDPVGSNTIGASDSVHWWCRRAQTVVSTDATTSGHGRTGGSELNGKPRISTADGIRKIGRCKEGGRCRTISKSRLIQRSHHYYVPDEVFQFIWADNEIAKS